MSYTTCLSMGGDSILSTHRRPTPPTNYTAHTLPNWQIAEIAIFFEIRSIRSSNWQIAIIANIF
jgi:hypothetical protein